MYFDDLNKKYIILDIEGNSAQKENERKITQFAALIIKNVKWFDVIEDVKKYLSPTKTKLSVAANEYGFDDTNFHNALVDCYATLHLMKTIEQVRSITIWYI